MGLSHLGIFHTIIGVVAIIAAIISLIKSAKIDLSKVTGKIYFYCTLITSLTALGLSSVKGVNPGHILAFLIVVLISVAYFLYAKKKGNNRSRFIENFFLSFSFFLSLIPTVNETFSRVPVGHPLAKGPTDPLIGKTLLLLFILFIASSILQFRKQKRVNKFA
jgi:cbb3-type cytochrome oxidase subunit 3